MFRLFSIFLIALFLNFAAHAADRTPADLDKTDHAIATSKVGQYRTGEELTFSCDKTNIGTQGALICAYQIAGMHDMMMVLMPNLKGF